MKSKTLILQRVWFKKPNNFIGLKDEFKHLFYLEN